MNSLEEQPTQTIPVETKKTVITGKIGSPEFEKNLAEELAGRHAWRSSVSLATKIGVDAKELEKFLDKDKRFLRRLGKDDTILYAFMKRVGEQEPATQNNKQTTIHPKDRLSLGSIHLLSVMLETVLEKYSLKIHESSEESFSHLTKSLHHIKCASVLLTQATKTNPEFLI